jgi:hypothetical protein
MRNQNLIVAAAFMSGLLTGMLAVAGYDRATESPQPVASTGPAGSGAGPGRAPVEEADAERPIRAAALSSAPEEALPAAPEATEERAGLESRLSALTAGWTQMQGEMARLRGRVSGLEKRVAAAGAESGTDRGDAAAPERRDTTDARRTALVEAGLTAARAEDVLWRQGQQELDRLELRDLAIREGWFRSDRYRDELREIRDNDVDLRAEIGEDSYDRYLFAAGEDNRVEIASIIPGSRADEAGLQPGDMVESYGEERVFSFEDLRSATSDGEREELVPVRLRRGDALVEMWIPRGPLGVRLDRARAKPEG